MGGRVMGGIAVALAAAGILLSLSGEANADKRAAALLGKTFRAFRDGDYETAYANRAALERAKLANRDYAQYAVGQSAFLLGDHKVARSQFVALAKNRSSRFSSIARWRVADSDWQLGNLSQARKAYERLVRGTRGKDDGEGDVGVALYRIAEAWASERQKDRAMREFRGLYLRFPRHPLAREARRRVRELGGANAGDLSADDRIERAVHLTDQKLWREAVLELDIIASNISDDLRDRKLFQLGQTLFKMRRQYEMAGRILLELWPRLRKDADWALFHGARALSRAHKDEEAIGWYQKVVERFPRSSLAGEAQYLSGWLHFNLDHYEKAVPYLEEMLKRFPRDRWATWARWYLAFSHYLLGNYEQALPHFERLARSGDRLEGGKARYWRARALLALGKQEEAAAEHREIVGKWPFSWYALLSRSRLAELGIAISPFGDHPASPSDVPALSSKPSRRSARDPLIAKVDELIAADLGVEAGYELRRGEKGLLRRLGNNEGLAAALDRYRRAGNFNRPWMIAVVRGRRALSTEPKGPARTWWEHAYPLAYRKLVEKWRDEGKNPKYYLYSIMRKESGFNPHTLSYANALGLLQMIPPTTRRVAPKVGLKYTSDLLFDPESNIRLGSWYIGRLFHKFKEQVPVASASYNAGPGAVMRWLNGYGDHPIDEYVELISYRQARGYGKKVTETYARYLYLYEGTVYEQPLSVDRDFVQNDLTY